MRTTYIILYLFSIFSYSQTKDINQKDIFDIARFGTIQEIELLMGKNSDTINSINENGFTPLILACYKRNRNVAIYLIERVNNINYNSLSGTALAATVIKGNYELAKILLENNANPNLADENGITPLIYAIQFKNKELVELLLKFKAQKNIADAAGKKPFEYAVFTNNQDIINLIKN